MKSFKFKQSQQNQQKQIEQNIRQIRQQSHTTPSPTSSSGTAKYTSDNSMGEESNRERNSSYTEEQPTISEQPANILEESQRNISQKRKVTPKKKKELNSSYAKPTLSSRFKTVKKTVNRLAKYRPTQKVLGFKKSSSNKTYRLSMDPALIQSIQAL